jgi:hypothetical protein
MWRPVPNFQTVHVQYPLALSCDDNRGDPWPAAGRSLILYSDTDSVVRPPPPMFVLRAPMVTLLTFPLSTLSP